MRDKIAEIIKTQKSLLPENVADQILSLEIEAKGLIKDVYSKLRDIVYNVDERNVLFSFYMQGWALIKATPLQKATALAMAIRETQ